ncbi:hypothetical protein Q3G72_007585 [Acer saccharum]|nr:hypothetical protein Q3G72_007585 [Acer saccharum]
MGFLKTPCVQDDTIVRPSLFWLDEFVPQKTSAYVSQNDGHLGDLTVKETLDYSARFQGVGFRYDLVKELSNREKGAGIHPEADVYLFMKATAVLEGAESNLIIDYTLKARSCTRARESIYWSFLRVSGSSVLKGRALLTSYKRLHQGKIKNNIGQISTN